MLTKVFWDDSCILNVVKKSCHGSLDCFKLENAHPYFYYINRDFYFRNNTVKFTEKEIRTVCDVKGRVILWLNLKIYY